MFGSKKKKSKNSSPGLFRRLVRSIVSIVVLSALVLIISYTSKELSTFDTIKFTSLLGQVGLDQDQVGEVAGNFAKRVSDTDLGLIGEFSKDTAAQNEAVTQENIIAAKSTRLEETVTEEEDAKNGTVVLKVALFADSHSDIENLTSAISLAEDNQVKAIFHLGDHTNLGVDTYLEEAKALMDQANVPYYAVPGDRDLWQTVGPENFISIFGDNYHSVTLSGYKFVVLDNSANNTVVPDFLVNWFNTEVGEADFVLLSQPLYHPTNNKVMGITNGEEVTLVRQQAEELLATIRASNVKAIIAAEQHISSENTDPERSSLKHIVLGAITSTINERPQKILQSSRFSILSIYADGKYDIEQIIL